MWNYASGGDGMKRLGRLLFRLCSTASLVLCAAICVMWAQSYWRSFMFSLDVGTSQVPTLVGFEFGRGGLALGVRRVYEGVGTPPPATYRRAILTWDAPRHPLDAAPPDMMRLAGFSVGYFAEPDMALWAACVPCWFAVLVTAWLPVRTALKARRLRIRSTYRLCASCGYDLRASPDRCPECGIPAAPQGGA